jgi:Fe2+ transport system protein FeoA
MATLNQISVAETVTIQAITNPSFFESVANHGFGVGSDITIISKLPGALACEINASRFAIRSSDADSIVVSI